MVETVAHPQHQAMVDLNSSNQNSRQQSRLPQTGETDNSGWTWLGTTLLALVGLGKKRKKDNEN
ncbi:LPXTG cell wall anchor domain-containing protein [Pediococcus pentosaceus]|uniref:LPXTG cell wall anchor domain-containing protein n=1 Tax=Pediococcus pentosaceus TaxID=1255 RepID=UPI002073A83A|nr:LPXTG cell wall anchor domain-containing protein [Pediococcus pentosaceus]